MLAINYSVKLKLLLTLILFVNIIISGCTEDLAGEQLKIQENESIIMSVTPFEETQTPIEIVVFPSMPYQHEVQAVYSLEDFTFKEVSSFGRYSIANIETNDLDGDGDIDLILASEESNSIIQVYENLGDAVFRNSGNTFDFQSPDERHWNFGITVADFNGDSLSDIATADAWAGLNVYINYGQLRFARSQNYTFEGMGEVKGIVSDDIDFDGDIDIILGDHNGDSRGDRIFFNDGSGGMVDSGQSIGWDLTWDVFSIDVDRDGDIDYISVNRYALEPSRVHFNNGTGFFKEVYDIPNAFDDSMDIKCFANKNYTYCFIANSEHDNKRQNRILIFDESGNLKINKGFGPIGAETKGLSLVDLNLDGTLDLITGNYNGDSLVYLSGYEENGFLNFDESIPIFSIPKTTFIGCDDFNGDGLFDIIVGVNPADENVKEKYYLLLQESTEC